MSLVRHSFGHFKGREGQIADDLRAMERQVEELERASGLTARQNAESRNDGVYDMATRTPGVTDMLNSLDPVTVEAPHADSIIVVMALWEARWSTPVGHNQSHQHRIIGYCEDHPDWNGNPIGSDVDVVARIDTANLSGYDQFTWLRMGLDGELRTSWLPAAADNPAVVPRVGPFSFAARYPGTYTFWLRHDVSATDEAVTMHDVRRQVLRVGVL